MAEARFLRHTECPRCGSHNNLAVYEDHSHCFTDGCGYHKNNNAVDRALRDKERQQMPMTSLDEVETREVSKRRGAPLTPLTDVFRAIPRRGLTEESVRKYGIDINLDKTLDVAHRYPYFKNGVHVANKVRKRDKTAKEPFYWEGDPSGAELFGQHLFKPGSAKAITLTEGEIDAPSGYQLQGSLYPVVSVPSVGAAVKAVKDNYEYLDSFEEIVVCMDADEARKKPDGTTFYPGQEVAKKIAELFRPGKCRILTLEKGKDPSDYLQARIDPKDFMREWWKAPAVRPDGLVVGTDDALWDAIINSPKPFTVPFPSDRLNHMTAGLRLGEMITITANPKIGKTTLLKWIEYSLLMNPVLIESGYGVGFMHFEEPKKDLAVGLMGLHVNKRLGLPETETNEKELRDAYDAVINNPRVIIWDHFGSNSVDAVVSKVRHMAALGCKYIVIDHFSIIVSDQEGDERKRLDEIATRLKTLTIELDICLIGVIHQNRAGEIRGTMAFEQLSNLVIKLTRDKMEPDEWRRNVTEVAVTDNRFTGRTGPCEWLFFEDHTGQMMPLDEDAIEKYEAGMAVSDGGMGW